MSARRVAPAAAAALADFAADALDWPAVRELYAREVASSLGRRALAELAPLGDADARAAHRRTAEMIAALGAGGPPLAGVLDPLAPIEAARAARRGLALDELFALLRLLEATATIRAWLAERAGSMPETARLAARIGDLGALRAELDRALDPRRAAVRDEASPALARLRREAEELEREVGRAVRGIAARPELRGHLAEGHAGRVQRRGDRLVLAVKAKSRGRVPGLVHDRSQSGETLYVEPAAVVESQNRLAECRAQAAHEEARVLAELGRAVLRSEEAIARTAGALAELELAWASARFARAQDARPTLAPGDPGAAPELSLRAARHPLLVEEARAGRVDEVVPIDLRLGDDFDLLVVTGPNTGGKTLALKTAGLAALAARLGLPFPCAEGSTVPLYAGVVADIGDEQEIQQSLSTFSSHLARVRAGLERAGPGVLCLLDELGGGTDPEEGAALGWAILEELLERGAPTLASTHLGKLKELAFRHPRVENASAEFDLRTLAPRYRLLVGVPGESRALAIARRLGLPESVLGRAAERIERSDAELEALLADVRDSRVRAERARSEAETRLADVAAAERELGERAREVVRQRGTIAAEAERELEGRLRSLAASIEAAGALAARLPREHAAALRELVASMRAATSGSALSDRRRAFLGGLSKGDEVFVTTWRKHGTITRLWRDRRELSVRVGRRILTVSYDDVSQWETP